MSPPPPVSAGQTRTMAASSSARRSPGAEPSARSTLGGALGIVGRGLFRDARGAGLATLYCVATASLYFGAIGWWRTQPLPTASWPWLTHDATFFCLLTVVVHECLYWGIGGAQMACDRYGWLRRFKLSRKHKGQQLDADVLRDTVQKALVGHFVLQPIAAVLVWPLFGVFQCPAWDDPLPPASKIFLQLFFAISLNECLFYWSHRWLHTKLLFNNVHYQHHRWQGTIAWAGEYAHPLEMVVSNYVPFMLGPLVGRFHMQVWCAWITWRM